MENLRRFRNANGNDDPITLILRDGLYTDQLRDENGNYILETRQSYVRIAGV